MTDGNRLVEIKVAIAGVIGTLTALWGWLGWLFWLWVALMAADWVMGSAAAMKEGRWSSEKLREGAWHKAGMALAVGVAAAADLLIGALLDNIPGVALPFDYSTLLAPLTMVWYCVGELGSLAETAVKMGAPVPKWLPKILDICQDSIDSVGDKLTEDKKDDQ